MSWQATRYVKQLRDDRLTPHDGIVLMVLGDYHRTAEGSRIWPSVLTLAADCKMSRSGVKKVLRRLEEYELVKRNPGNGRGNTTEYVLVQMEGRGQIDTPEEERGHGEHAKGSPRDQKGVTASTRNKEEVILGERAGEEPKQGNSVRVAPYDLDRLSERDYKHCRDIVLELGPSAGEPQSGRINRLWKETHSHSLFQEALETAIASLGEGESEPGAIWCFATHHAAGTLFHQGPRRKKAGAL